MKRILSILFSIAVISLVTVPCFAVEMPEATDVDVNAKFVSEVKNEYKSEVKEQKAEVTLPDGTKIQVDGVTQTGLFLVVIPVEKTDTDAYLWLLNCLKDKGTNPYPMDIFFEDSYGNRVEIAKDFTIQITFTYDYQNPIICYTDTDGNSTVIKSNVDRKTITFTTSHNSYYSIVEKKAESVNSTINNDVSSPHTGDNSNINLWVVILLASCGIITIILIKNKQRILNK